MARLKYPELAPRGYAALSAFGHYVSTETALEPVLLGLVYLRVSLLNGCDFCIQLHKAELRRHHEPESRIEGVATAPDSEAFTPREQAAMRWAAAVTQLKGQAISEEEYALVSRFFHGKDLVDLTFAIANINAWNRMGVAFQPHWRPQTADQAALPQKPFPEQSRVAKMPVLGSLAAGGDGDASADAAQDDDGGKVASD